MSELSRRSALRAGAAAVGAVAALGVAAPSAVAARRRLPQRAAFERALGRTFSATSGGTRHRLRLVEVGDLPFTKARHRSLCFDLTFVPAGHGTPLSGIVRLRRPGFRSTELFVSPVGSGNRLQAVVDRSR